MTTPCPMSAQVHLAAIVSVPLCQQKISESYETNLLATARLVESIRNTDPSIKLVFASSASVYGNAGTALSPILETTPLEEPLSFYGAQKLGSEQIIRLAHGSYGIPAVVFHSSMFLVQTKTLTLRTQG